MSGIFFNFLLLSISIFYLLFSISFLFAFYFYLKVFSILRLARNNKSSGNINASTDSTNKAQQTDGSYVTPPRRVELSKRSFSLSLSLTLPSHLTSFFWSFPLSLSVSPPFFPITPSLFPPPFYLLPSLSLLPPPSIPQSLHPFYSHSLPSSLSPPILSSPQWNLSQNHLPLNMTGETKLLFDFPYLKAFWVWYTGMSRSRVRASHP